jgi:homoserine kinase
MLAVSVPASSANLGPGFDALGIALSLRCELGVVDERSAGEQPAGSVDEHHPASVAFTRAGGRGTLWVRSPIPIGRGLGFSGAMRVGGAALAVLQRSGPAGLGADGRRAVLAVAAELEEHADNAAASLYGGIVATDGVSAVVVPTPLTPDVVVWVPADATATLSSRAALPGTVSRADAVFNIGRTATLVAALAAGDVAALAAATEDRLHQHARLAAAPASASALAAGRAAGAWCGWLSGSGPTVAFLAARGEGAALAAALPESGHTKVLGVDRAGLTVATATARST